MTAGGADPRVAAVEALLARAGLAAVVTAAGSEGEIAAVRGGVEMRARLAELAPEVRSLGFRYVALELKATEDDEDT